MTTATGDYALDFSVLGDVDPYTNADFAAIGGDFKIFTNALRPVNSASPRVFRYIAAVDSGIIESKVEISYAYNSGTSTDDVVGPSITRANGDGYAVLVSGEYLIARPLALGVMDNGADIVFNSAQTYQAGDVVSLRLDIDSGDISILLNGVQIGSTGNNTTYDSALSAGIYEHWTNNNGNGAVSFAADGIAAGLNVTSINSGADIETGDTGIEIAVTNPGSAGTVRQSGILLNVQDWNNPILVDTLDIENTLFKYEAHTFEIENAAAESDTITANIIPLAGSKFTNLSGLLVDTGARITAIPNLASGDQARYSAFLYLNDVETAYGVTLNPDGSISIAGSPPNETYKIKVRAWSASLGWGAEATQTFIVNLSNITSVSTTQNILWNLLNAANATDSIQWAIESQPGQVLTSATIQWNLLQSVLSNTDARWDLLNAVLTNENVSWSMVESVSQSGDVQWAIEAAAGTAINSFDIEWNLLNATVSDTDLRWSLLNDVTINSDVRWSMVEAVLSTVDVRWDLESVFASVEISADVRWSLMAIVSQSIDANWSVLNSVTGSSDARWNLVNAVATNIQAEWGVISGAQIAANISWDLVGQTETSQTIRWNIQGDVEFPDIVGEITIDSRSGNITVNTH